MTKKPKLYIYKEEADAFLEAMSEMRYAWVTNINPLPIPYIATTSPKTPPLSVGESECSIAQQIQASNLKREAEKHNKQGKNEQEVFGYLLRDSKKNAVGGAVQVSENEWVVLSNSADTKLNGNVTALNALQREAALQKIAEITRD